MTEPHAGTNRSWWSQRPDFPDIIELLRIAAACEETCVPNYLVQHIGMCDSASRKAVNFIAIKGSRRASFSLELKLAPDERKRQQLCNHKGWEVDRWDRVHGYRVHLPHGLSSEDIEFLKPFVAMAEREFDDPRQRR